MTTLKNWWKNLDMTGKMVTVAIVAVVILLVLV
jgi:flagellar biosynthesis/type III secretory pathway M-ring protein FliF/YscJ